MARYKALVAGASGVVGRRLAEYLASRGDWEVTGLSRRAPAGAPFKTIAVDLTDARDCAETLRGLTDTTHILYAARFQHMAAAPEPIEANTDMLRNLVEVVAPGAAGLQHVHMVQGSKYYGSTLGPYKTPARESDPRVAGASFYYAQEDCIHERRQGKRWTWSASRPHAVMDRTTGIARSIAMVVAVYAAILKEEGLPLSFPGTAGNYRAVYQCTDATLLAKAIAWMSTETRCANQAFNIINGDYIRWANLWPVFAEYFGMKPGPVSTVRLAEVMPGKAPVWERIVGRHGLVPTPYGKTADWSYGDFVFRPEYDIMSDMTRARQAGFGEALDTERMFIELFDFYRSRRIIPAG
jgi:nucleoside-diphosphate-sugar epimerase